MAHAISSPVNDNGNGNGNASGANILLPPNSSFAAQGGVQDGPALTFPPTFNGQTEYSAEILDSSLSGQPLSPPAEQFFSHDTGIQNKIAIEPNSMQDAPQYLASQLATPSSLIGTQPGGTQMLPFGDFDDYLMFLDNNIPYTQVYSSISQFEQPMPSFSPDPMLFIPDVTPQRLNDNAAAAMTQSESNDQSSFSRFGSRLPSLQPEEQHEPPPPPKTSDVPFPGVSAILRSVFAHRLERYQHATPIDFALPTRHALSRYLAGYVTGFHEHLPFLHVPTLSISSTAVELILAMAAVGAQYCREPEKSVQLFHVANVVAMESINNRDRSELQRKGSKDTRSIIEPQQSTGIAETPIETIQALLLLMAMATWFEQKDLARATVTMRSQLESLVHDEGLSLEIPSHELAWKDWIHFEGSKRTKFITYCFFNLHCIAFEIPPLILNRQLGMSLPCSEAQWKAKSAEDWESIRQSQRPEATFQDAFADLFKEGGANHLTPMGISTLGGYILIHALVQRIWFVQQISREQADSQGASSLVEACKLESALRSWQTSWARNPESSVNPLNPHGPLSFNSSALLRIAYIRLNVDTGPIRSLRSWDPVQIATSIKGSPPIRRGKRMTRAALHCAHALSIPIKLGINFVAHTQMFFWSTQHALCSLECALLLTKWLESITMPRTEPPLSIEEQQLLNFVIQMVAETEYVPVSGHSIGNGQYLSSAVVRLWAKLFRSDSIWQLIDVIGRSLDIYAEMLEA